MTDTHLPIQKNRGFRRLVSATGYSCKGLKYAFINEEAFRIEVVVSLIGLPLSIWLGRTVVETLLLAGSLLLILTVELLNTAVEAIVDRIGPEHHVLSGAAKDVASAAVLMVLLLAFTIWATIAVARIWFFLIPA